MALASLLIAAPAFIACAQDGNHCGQVRYPPIRRPGRSWSVTEREVLALVELGPVPSGRGRHPALRSSATREARILRSLPDQDDGANQRGTLNGRPDETSFLSGVEASNGQAGKSAQHGQ
jgi:hypothetical protein